MRNLGRRSGPSDRGNLRPFIRPSRRDPDAMDVDAMTTEERDRLMKTGACFRCKEKGHLSRECPNKNTKYPSNETTRTKKQNPKDVAKHIQSILAQYTAEEEEEIQKASEELDEEDF